MKSLIYPEAVCYNSEHEQVLSAPAHALINVHVRGEAMTSIDSTHELISVKRCTKCGERYPATAEFFTRNKNLPMGLSPWCRICHKTSSQKYRLEHKARILENNRAYRKAHPHVHRASINRRRVRKMAGVSVEPFDEHIQLMRQKSRCYYCGKKLVAYHIDHVIPLSRGGTDHPDNKVLACPSCNLKKNDKLPHEWLKGGRLL
jgi:5-methylcytosine-specific restriction endonuclease McrA